MVELARRIFSSDLNVRNLKNLPVGRLDSKLDQLKCQFLSNSLFQLIIRTFSENLVKLRKKEKNFSLTK